LVRRNSEWHHFDPLGTAGVLTNGSASVVSNNLYDAFGVLRYTQGSAQTPWRASDFMRGLGYDEAEGLTGYSDSDLCIRWRGVGLRSNIHLLSTPQEDCLENCRNTYLRRQAHCYAQYRRCLKTCWIPALCYYRCNPQLSLCLGYAYRDFLDCQIQCYNSYLY